MKLYCFEIVRRPSGRFAWIFVRIDDRGREVLARSERSYRTTKRVLRAIAKLEDAPVVDTTTGYLPLQLPATGFSLVPNVVPLVVDESPVRHHAVFRMSAEKARKSGDQKAEETGDKEEVAAAAPPAKPASRRKAAR
jgi:hypothetical protein